MTVIYIGIAMLAFGLLVEALWYVMFARRSPGVQRWSAQISQFLRVLVVGGVIHWGWKDLYIIADDSQIWIGQCTILVILLILGTASLSPRWDVEGVRWQERFSGVTRYLYRIPYDVRWYLRRTTIGNAIISTIALYVGTNGEKWALDGLIPINIILFPAMATWFGLTLIRRLFCFFEPPPWEGPNLHFTNQNREPARPGMPEPLDVVKYLNRPSRRTRE